MIQSKDTVAQVSGFTPVFDVLIEAYGQSTALVFGAIWRYCQMSDGCCKASQETIAKRTGYSRQTVNAAVKLLVADGYLMAVRPAQSGQVVTLYDTGKVRFKVVIAAQPGPDKPDFAARQDVIESPKPPARPARQPAIEPVKSLDRGCQTSLQGGVKLLDTKIDSNIQEDIYPGTFVPAEPEGIQETCQGEESSLEVEPPSRRPSVWLDIARDGRPIKNQSAYDAIERYERKQEANGGLDLYPSWLPERYQVFYAIFVRVTGIQPIGNREQKSWIVSMQRLLEANITPDIFERALRKLLSDGVTVATPFSVFNTARALAGSKSAGPGFVPSEEY